MVGAPGGPATSPSATPSATRPLGSRAATHAAASAIGAPPSSDTLGMARNSASSAICSEEGTAAVDRDDLAGQPLRLHQEHDALGDVLRLAQAPQRDPVQHRRLALVAVGLPLGD